MRSILFALAFVVGSHCSFGATPGSIDDLATHHQVGVIEIADQDNPMKINAFCLDAKGQIVAACGAGPGEVRVVNDEGEILQSWAIDVKPESIGVADDGNILVGGEGKLLRFTAGGKLLKEVTAPHAKKLRSDNQQLRKVAIDYLNRRRNPLASRIATYESIIKQLETRAASSELNETEERMLETLPKTLEKYKEQAAAQKEEEEEGPSEADIQAQVESLIKSKMRISSISSSGDHVLVTTRGIEGYGYDVWKTDRHFGNGEIIVSELRGCCGQMDVQCCKQGIFVAENSRDRVVHFDINGKEITHWGKSDRTGINGFSSCCNPMNVCFDTDGHVYTAEATTGRIKRFSAEGELLAYIGDVDLVPGCKNVSIAVSPVNDNIYMLDLTRNHIKMMQPKPEKSAEDSTEKSEERAVKSEGKPSPADVTSFGFQALRFGTSRPTRISVGEESDE